MPMPQRPFEDRHDIVAFSSLIVLVLPPTVGGLWIAAHLAMRVLALDPSGHPHFWEGFVVLVGGLLGLGSGCLLGSILWVSLMSRVLPSRTVTKWALGNVTGRVRVHAERLVQHFTASSHERSSRGCSGPRPMPH